MSGREDLAPVGPEQAQAPPAMPPAGDRSCDNSDWALAKAGHGGYRWPAALSSRTIAPRSGSAAPVAARSIDR
jgi:hypothetical protein